MKADWVKLEYVAHCCVHGELMRRSSEAQAVNEFGYHLGNRSINTERCECTVTKVWTRKKDYKS